MAAMLGEGASIIVGLERKHGDPRLEKADFRVVMEGYTVVPDNLHLIKI